MLHPNISALHYIGYVLAMPNDILTAMKKGEVTISASQSRPTFYSFRHCRLSNSRYHCPGFCKASLRWITSYLTDRQHFVGIDNWVSKKSGATFGKALFLALLYLYVNDLSEVLPHSVKHITSTPTIQPYTPTVNLKLYKTVMKLQVAWNASCSGWSEFLG